MSTIIHENVNPYYYVLSYFGYDGHVDKIAPTAKAAVRLYKAIEKRHKTAQISIKKTSGVSFHALQKLAEGEVE